jgi:hypothetical protein
MLGKLYALCLCKYVRLLLLRRGRVRWLRHLCPVKMMIIAYVYRFKVAFSNVMSHNYKYIDDS